MRDLRHSNIYRNGIRQHYAEASDGPPVILLTAFPETWFGASSFRFWPSVIA